MEKLLEGCFGKHYGSTKHATANCRVLKGQFIEVDLKACDDCRNHSPKIEACCDKAVLKCDSSGHNVKVIQLEEFIGNYANLKAILSGRRCDLLLVDENKIVFCDMTCSKPKYIDDFVMKDGAPKIGKRNTVRKQIGNSIKLLTDIPEIRKVIMQKKDRIALFAYREKPEPVGKDFYTPFSSNMRSFGMMEDKVLDDSMYAEMENGFLFAEVRYPDVYIW